MARQKQDESETRQTVIITVANPCFCFHAEVDHAEDGDESATDGGAPATGGGERERAACLWTTCDCPGYLPASHPTFDRADAVFDGEATDGGLQ